MTTVQTPQKLRSAKSAQLRPSLEEDDDDASTSSSSWSSISPSSSSSSSSDPPAPLQRRQLQHMLLLLLLLLMFWPSTAAAAVVIPAVSPANCFTIANSLFMPDFNGYSILAGTQVFDTASLDAFLSARLDNNPSYLEGFRSTYDCATWDGTTQRFHYTFYQALLVTYAQNQGKSSCPPPVPNIQVCKSSCLLAFQALTSIFNNPASCPGPDAAGQRTKTLALYQSVCDLLPAASADCIVAVAAEATQCGFPLFSDAVAYCAITAVGTDPCCGSLAQYSFPSSGVSITSTSSGGAAMTAPGGGTTIAAGPSSQPIASVTASVTASATATAGAAATTSSTDPAAAGGGASSMASNTNNIAIVIAAVGAASLLAVVGATLLLPYLPPAPPAPTQTDAAAAASVTTPRSVTSLLLADLHPRPFSDAQHQPHHTNNHTHLTAAAVAALRPSPSVYSASSYAPSTIGGGAGGGAGAEGGGGVVGVGAAGLFQMRVVHDYEAALADELTLVPGDIVTVTALFDDGWGHGVLSSSSAAVAAGEISTGAFPLACVAPLDAAAGGGGDAAKWDRDSAVLSRRSSLASSTGRGSVRRGR
ncbi:hypothetical protein DFJ73DRAFT_936063 [Zopfochytrium polystomum]|nr:hypothetical protein DFJ73DRAFT_936063 [Zopfochytrium polystomum]